MSSLLFLGQIIATLVLAYWAFRNDAIRSGEGGEGLFAMKPARDAEPASARPMWKKYSNFKSLPVTGAIRQLTGPRKSEPKTSPRWKRSWRRGPEA
jgi:hypothetical protein